MIYLKIILFSIIFSIFITGCSSKFEQKPHISKANLQEVSWKNLDSFKKDNLSLSFDVFKKACTKSKKYQNLQEVCNLALNTNDSKDFFTSNFTPYKLLDEDGTDEGLITGYYEPILKGSLKQTNRYKYPIYKTPKDLLIIDFSDIYPELKKYRLRGKVIGNKVVPYDSREDIETINNQNNLEVICYVDDKVDLFFLHIQGSGKVELEDGKILNVGYAQQNGRAYYAIGRNLIENNYVKKEDMSLQSIKKWLSENPTKIDEVLNLNQSYIFFHKSPQTATGSLGVELTAFRNLAVDREYIPLGFPVFINTTNPLDNKPIKQLMIAADTGGAIKGKIRADFFFGNGQIAEELAGKMKQKGSLYILIPNNIKNNKNHNNKKKG